ncbi:START domain-containing protein [Aliiglaciecola sp. LCG003]|uniref:START domain-containing protein n=1 Tax=Aliiglaciecola sp. LCG003 TaxID=3053655 RepID=UPI00257417B3|nr:START domain-containing protein [Aliiglaciecola sp. LCG003]WJG07970.1 START domain-containing protein [Aliiglaciecola sp. LCG003]
MQLITVIVQRSIFKYLPLFYCFVWASTALAITETAAANNWQLAKQNESLKVFKQPTDSGYAAIKAELVIHSTAAEFLALLERTDIAPQWIANCERVQVLAKPSPNIRVVRTIFSAPWPVKDRDMVTHSTTTLDPADGSVSIKIIDYTEHFPATKQYVRMEKVAGTWEVLPRQNGQVLIRYTGYGEPSGNLPRWLANQILVSSTYDTFIQLQKLLAKEV